MPNVRRKLVVPLLGYLVAFGPLSIDMYLPSLPTIAVDLAASQHTIQGTITVFLFGMAFGMLRLQRKGLALPSIQAAGWPH